MLEVSPQLYNSSRFSQKNLKSFIIKYQIMLKNSVGYF